MKKSIIAIIAVVILAGAWSGAKAQDNITSVTYQVSVPLGDLENYIGKTSWIGWGIEGRHFRSPDSKITLGFSFAWHVFDDELTTTTQVNNGAVTGYQQRYVNSLPFLVTADYYLDRTVGKIKPYVGVGAGAYYVVEQLNIGVYKDEESTWCFGLEGEAGLQWPVSDVEGLIAVRYHYAIDAGQTYSGADEDFAYFTAVIGVAYARW